MARFYSLLQREWEAVGTPAEAVFDGKEMLIQVTYNETEEVDKIELLKGNEKELQKYKVAKSVGE